MVLPVKPLVITFDDGHAANYALLSVIKDYSVPITFFVCSDIVGTNRQFWFNEIYKLKVSSWEIPNNQRLKLLSATGFYNNKEYENAFALTQRQISELLSAGCKIQSHTATHPILPMCDNETAREEIFKSKTNLEDHFNVKVNYIAYPNGDYGDREMELCKEAGYQMGLTVDLGYNNLDINPFRLKRIGISDEAGINQLAVMATGVWAFCKSLVFLMPRNRYFKSLKKS